MRTVKDILNSKPKPTNLISSDKLVIDALNMLNAVNLSYLIVQDGDEFKGIFSEKEYSRNIALKGRSSSTTKVSEVMSTDLPKVTLTDTVEHCMNEMANTRTRYLLAYRGNSFEGVITIHDILRQVVTNREAVFDDTLTQKLIDSDEGGGRIY